MSSVGIGPEQERYLERVISRLTVALPAPHEPVGVYLSGSAVLGDWTAGASDLDVIVITGGPLPTAAKHRVRAGLAHRALPCPARGLELVVYALGTVARPSPPIRFELNFNTGAGMPEHFAVHADDEPGHWFVLDLAVARSHGRALVGPRADRLIGTMADSAVLDALAESWRWHRWHDRSGMSGVLNACRAWRYAVDGVWSSKTAGARWAVEQGWHADTITAALGLRLRPRRQLRENVRHARDAR